MNSWLFGVLVAVVAHFAGGCKKKHADPIQWQGIPYPRACTESPRDGKWSCMADGKEYSCIQDDLSDNVVCIETYRPCTHVQ